MSYTPGPWEAAHAGQGSFGGKFLITEYFVRRPGDNVAIAADVIDPESDKPSEANARLIAAAPDLLDVLKTIVRVADGRTIPGNLILDENSPLMDAARDAIAKATGGTA